MRVVPINPDNADDLDGLLRAYFRRQMPHPWPAPPVPHPSPKSNASRPPLRTLIRGRWALAASLALLSLCSMLLPGRFTAKSQNGQPFSGTGVSERRHLLPNPVKKNKDKAVEQPQRHGLADDGDPPAPWDAGDMQFDR